MINDSDDLFSWSEKANSREPSEKLGSSIVSPAPTSHLSSGAWMKSAGDPVNGGLSVAANELTSLSALIVYVAQKTGVSEFRTERELANHFNVPNVSCLPATQFDQAIRFLVDRVPLKLTTN